MLSIISVVFYGVVMLFMLTSNEIQSPINTFRLWTNLCYFRWLENSGL